MSGAGPPPGGYRWLGWRLWQDVVVEGGQQRLFDSAEPERTMITVYTDGACSGNPGPGGWAWAVAPSGDLFGSGSERATTNQRMELLAVLEAIRSIGLEGHRIHVVSDSTYVVNCFRDRWWVKWRRNGWKNSQRQPVANVDLWEPLVAFVEQGDVTFEWVKGHSGDAMNDLVDRLAVAAIPDR